MAVGPQCVWERERKGEGGKRILPRSRPAEEEAAGREWEEEKRGV